MSFFNNIEKIAYRKHTDDPVVLQEYIKFTDEKQREKYLVFKFKNNLTQRVKDIKVLVNLFDRNNLLIGTTTFVYKDFVAKGLEEFVPTAKLAVNFDTKYIEVKVVYALFDALVWEEGKLKKVENLPFDTGVTIERKTNKKTNKVTKKVEVEVAPKGSRKTKLKDISKGNRVRFPKVLAGILSIVLIGITIFGVYNVRNNSKSLSDKNFEYEIVSSSKKEVAITKYVGSSSKPTIPTEFKKFTITAIEGEAFDGSKVKSVTFEGGKASKITIKSNAFVDCSDLEDIIDEKGAVKTISKSSFKNCENLIDVILPNAKLLEGAFDECDAIETLSVKEIIPEELYDTGVPTSLVSLTVASVDISSSYFFEGYKNIITLRFTGESFVIKEGLTELSRLRNLYIGELAEVAPKALVSFGTLTVYLHEDNFYSAKKYTDVNPYLTIRDYE